MATQCTKNLHLGNDGYVWRPLSNLGSMSRNCAAKLSKEGGAVAGKGLPHCRSSAALLCACNHWAPDSSIRNQVMAEQCSDWR